tara:strand:+ start:678 stop:995 length:318 start_codon:yes stop_codon:yes gene_type:complete
VKTEIKKKKPAAKKVAAEKPLAKKKVAKKPAAKQKRNPGKKDMFGKPYDKAHRKSAIPDKDILPHQQIEQLYDRGEFGMAEHLENKLKRSLKGTKKKKSGPRMRC